MFERKSVPLLGLALGATLAGSAWADVLKYQGQVTQGTATFNVFLNLNRPQPTKNPGQAFASGRIETNVPGSTYLLQSGSLKDGGSVVAKVYLSEAGRSSPVTAFSGQLSGGPGTPTSQILANFDLRFAGKDYTGVAVTLTPVGLATAVPVATASPVPPVPPVEPVEIGGVGVYIRLDPSNGNALTVDRPMADKPAIKAGILPGDVILQIDSTPTAGITIPQAQALLKGKIGSKIRLLVRRGAFGWHNKHHHVREATTQWYELTRAQVDFGL